MSAQHGSLYLVPNTLDFGAPGDAAGIAELLPLGVLRIAARLEHWVCENAKTTRAFLKRVAAACPLAMPLQELAIVELPRPTKGRAAAAGAGAGADATVVGSGCLGVALGAGANGDVCAGGATGFGAGVGACASSGTRAEAVVDAPM